MPPIFLAIAQLSYDAAAQIQAFYMRCSRAQPYDWLGGRSGRQVSIWRFLSGGDHVIALKHFDRARSAIVHVPARAAERRDLPLIINFHGEEATDQTSRSIL